MPKTETVLVRKGKHDIPIQCSKIFRTRFERNHGKGSLQKLLCRFVEDRESLEEIGSELKISVQWLRTIYNRLLSKTPGFTSVMTRKRQCKIARVVKTYEPPEPIRWFLDEAKKNNCYTRYELRTWRPVSVKTRALVINGAKCVIRISKKFRQRRGGTATYARTYVTGFMMKESDFQIFILSPRDGEPKCFIVPSEVFLESYKFNDRRIRNQISIPCKKMKNRRQTYIDWWQYENAWHLLGGQGSAEITPKVRRSVTKKEFVIPPDIKINNRVDINPHLSVLNGKKCSIRFLASVFRSSKAVRADYMRTTLLRSTLLNTDLQIFALQLDNNEEKHFIVPSKVLLESYKIETDALRGVYIPRLPRTENPAYPRKAGLLNWYSYENAWHLLEQRS